MIARILILTIKAYKLLISPCLHWICGPGSGCRFNPSCSEYCLEAIRLHGAVRGLLLGARRICKCHPWGGFGFDPVPAPMEEPLLFTLAGKKPPFQPSKRIFSLVSLPQGKLKQKV